MSVAALGLYGLKNGTHNHTNLKTMSCSTLKTAFRETNMANFATAIPSTCAPQSSYQLLMLKVTYKGQQYLQSHHNVNTILVYKHIFNLKFYSTVALLVAQ